MLELEFSSPEWIVLKRMFCIRVRKILKSTNDPRERGNILFCWNLDHFQWFLVLIQILLWFLSFRMLFMRSLLQIVVMLENYIFCGIDLGVLGISCFSFWVLCISISLYFCPYLNLTKYCLRLGFKVFTLETWHLGCNRGCVFVMGWWMWAQYI